MQAKNKLLISIIIILNSFCLTNANNIEWKNFTNYTEITDILDDNTNLWIATINGLIKFNKKTEEISYLNRTNSNLPENKILSLGKDRSENIWIGTEHSGVAKYNGTNWQTFNKSNSELASNQLNKEIAIKNSGEVYIGSAYYLSIYDGSNWANLEAITSPLSNLVINSIKFDRDGNAWLGASWGLSNFDGSAFTQYDQFNCYINTLAIDNKNNIWIGTKTKGLIKFNHFNNTWTNYDTTNSGIPSNHICSIKIDSKNQIWVATEKGLSVYFNSNWTNYNSNNSELPTNNYINVIEIDQNDTIWIGLWKNGLIKFDGKSWKRYNLSQSPMSINSIYAIEKDKKGNIYIGGYEGLVYYNGSDWENLNDVFGFTNQSVLAIKEDNQGDMWFGLNTSNCLYHSDGDSWIAYDSTNIPLTLSKSHINTLEIDNVNDLWVGTNSSGLYHFNNDNWESLNINNTPLPSNIISAIAIDCTGVLWVGTLSNYFFSNGEPVIWEGGLAKKNDKNWIIYNKTNSGLPFNSISDLEFDSNGVLWAAPRDDDNIVGGNKGGGLVQYDGKDWKCYNMSNSPLTSNTIFDIFIDSQDNLWLGTYNGGLINFDKNNLWSIYNTSNSGITSNTVNCICEDDLGHFWLGHPFEGVSIYRKGGIMLDSTKNLSNPIDFELLQNYPNPFNESTIIPFIVYNSTKLTIEVYNILGQRVSSIICKDYLPGKFEIRWNGRNSFNQKLPSGIYMYILKNNEQYISKKMLLIH